MVEVRGVDGGKFLQTSHAAKALHRPLASSELQMGIFRPIDEPAAGFLSIGRPDFLQGGPVEAWFVGHDLFGPPVVPQRILQAFKGRR